MEKERFVNNFNEVVKTYGVYGTYVNWQPGGLNKGGFYYVFGLDKEKVLDKNIDMFQILERQARNRTEFFTDVMALKINERPPFLVFCDFTNRCQDLEAVTKIYNHLHLSIPVAISKMVLKDLKMTWENFTDHQKTPILRKNYEEMLRFIVNIENKNHNKNDTAYKKEQYFKKGYYDTGRSKLYNWFKIHFFKYKNEVSIIHLVAQAGKINTAKITYRNYKKIKKELNARQDILYSFSEIRGHVLKVADSEGYGSRENNDKRFYTLYYPTENTKDVERLIQKINYPVEFNRSLTDVDPNGCGTEHIVLPLEYYDLIKEDCDSKGLVFCIDHSARSSYADGIAIAFSVADSEKMWDIFINWVEVAERFHYKDAINQKPSNPIERINL